MTAALRANQLIVAVDHQDLGLHPAGTAVDLKNRHDHCLSEWIELVWLSQ
jgi:hypothetical protein